MLSTVVRCLVRRRPNERFLLLCAFFYSIGAFLFLRLLCFTGGCSDRTSLYRQYRAEIGKIRYLQVQAQDIYGDTSERPSFSE